MLTPILKHRSWPVVAALAIVFYLSRVLAEVGAQFIWPLGAIVGALIGLFGLALPATFLLLDMPISQIWPALLLWGYILYPFYDLRIAALIGIVMLIAMLIIDWPELNPRRVDWAIFIGVLALYWLTLARGLLPADAGEFQLAAATLGVAHPPGYPLYTMLGKLFTLLMPANPMRGLNLFSAVTTALAVMLAGRAARRLSGSVWAGLVTAGTLALAASIWSTATQASIRPLTAFFTALCIERLAAYRQTHRQQTLLGFFLAFGLGLTHHPSLAFPGLFFLIYLLLIDPALVRQPRRWPALFGAFALGLLPWAYLLIRGAAGAPLAPEGLATWSGFWDHVLARGFAGDFFAFSTAQALADRFLIWVNILKLQWNPVILVGALLAAINLARRDWRLFVLLFGGAALHSLITMTYRAPQTVEYLNPAYVELAILLGAGLGLVIPVRKVDGAPSLAAERVPFYVNAPFFIYAAGTAVLLASLLPLLIRSWPSFNALARDDSTREYAESLLESAPQDAVILANWHWATPLWTLQTVERLRPDVETIYVYPEGAEPLAQTWIGRIDGEIGSRPVVVTGYYPAEFAATPYFFEPLGPGWLVRQAPRTDLPPGMTPFEPELTFDNGMTLIGYQVVSEAAVGQTFEVRVAWRVDEPQSTDLTATVHLVNPTQSIANGDTSLPTSRAEVGDVLVSQHILGMPPYGLPSPEDQYSLLAALYLTREDGTRQVVSYSIRFNFVTLEEAVVAPAPWPAPTTHPRNIVFVNGARLRGFDWEGSVLYLHAYQPDRTPRTMRVLPQSAPGFIDQIAGSTPRLGPWGIGLRKPVRIPAPRPGERYIPLGGQMILTYASVAPQGSLTPGAPVTVDLRLTAARPLLVDNVVKVDLIGEGYAWREQSDHIPATGAIPTLKWLYGWQIGDRHRLTVPADASPLAAHAELVVYDHFTGQVRPILDVDLARGGIAVPIATFE